MVAALELPVGSRFGRWTVLSVGTSQRKWQRSWRARCDCGAESSVPGSTLVRGLSKSCGCLRHFKEAKHGGCGTPEYGVWAAMVQRCTNPKHQKYAHYGGRGIVVCKRWLKFEHFLADMGVRPSPKHTIERVDNDGPYAPRNCVWLHQALQKRNFSRNRLVTIGDETLPVCVWADVSGISSKVIYDRLDLGWETRRAVFQPVRGGVR